MNILNNKEKIEKIDQEKTTEIINTLDATATNLKMRNLSKDLEYKTKNTIRTLQSFSEAVPPMIERIEKINAELKLEEFENSLKRIEEAATVTQGAINFLSINANNSLKIASNSLEQLNSEATKGIKTLVDKGKNSLAKNEEIRNIIHITLMVVFFVLALVNIYMYFSYKSYVKDTMELINRNNIEINIIHDILSGDSKYWYNIENKKLYIKDMKIKNKNSNK